MRGENRARLREASAGLGDGGEGFEFGGSVYGEDQGLHGLYDDEWDYADEDSGAAWFESLFNRDYKHGGGFGRREGSGSQGAGGADGARGTGKGDGKGRPGESVSGEDGSSRDELLISRLARVKDRYRLLVKRLHPDANPDAGRDQEYRELWGRVQRAYESGNLEELDLLMAISGALSGELAGALSGASTSLFHLRQLVHEVDRLAAPLRARIDEVRCSRAWKWRFGEMHQRVLLQRNIEQELARELAGLRVRLAEIATQIARFAPKRASSSRDERSPLVATTATRTDR